MASGIARHEDEGIRGLAVWGDSGLPGAVKKAVQQWLVFAGKAELPGKISRRGICSRHRAKQGAQPITGRMDW